MESTALSLNLRSYANQRLISEEIAILYRLCYAGQRLVNDAASTDVSMTNLGVAHLPIRETNMLTRSENLSIFKIRLQTDNDRSLCNLDSIGIL